MAISETPIEANSSVFRTVQLTPELVVFQTPPPGAHAKKVVVLPGKLRTLLTRPAPPPPLGMEVLPI